MAIIESERSFHKINLDMMRFIWIRRIFSLFKKIIFYFLNNINMCFWMNPKYLDLEYSSFLLLSSSPSPRSL